MMLGRGHRDDRLFTGRTRGSRRSEDPDVVGFGSAGGEDDLARRRPEAFGDSVSRLFQRATGRTAVGMQRGGVLPG